MVFEQTAAIDFPAFLVELRDFLAANGWTTLVNDTGNNILEMTNSNGHSFRFTRTSANRTQWNPNTASYDNITDYSLNMAYQKSDIGLAAGYSTAEVVNDMAGPFPNIWLFTDDAGTYCHMVIQTANLRYAHGSFGDLDNKGAHAFNIPYVAGQYWEWWWDYFDYTYEGNAAFNYPESGSHSIGYFAEGALTLGVPDGVVDPALNFTDGPLDNPGVKSISRRFSDRSIRDTLNYYLDFFGVTRNQTYTGGVRITPFPMFVQGAGNLVCFVGEIPTIGLVNMIGLSSGQTLTYAGEEWLVFPLKQYGLLENTNYGNNPLPVCNSGNYGIAVRKV